jgi:glycosyltransferase involved in cell wall biosynthesis
MTISVIIPTRNRAKNLRQTLLALQTQSLPKNEYEVIVSDDNSTDDTYWVVEGFKQVFNLRYVFNNHKSGTWNASTPRNLAAFISDPTSKLLVFVDSDVCLPFHALSYYREDFEKNPNRVIIGAYHWMNPMSPEIIAANIRNQEGLGNFILNNMKEADVRIQKIDKTKPDETFNDLSDGLACFGGNIGIPRKIFFNVGGYDDETHIGLEDGEMGIRLWKAGYRFSYDKRLTSFHQYHETPPDRFPSGMKEHIDRLNKKHFNTDKPDFNLINATRQAFSSWGIKNWEVPKQWLQ